MNINNITTIHFNTQESIETIADIESKADLIVSKNIVKLELHIRDLNALINTIYKKFPNFFSYHSLINFPIGQYTASRISDYNDNVLQYLKDVKGYTIGYNVTRCKHAYYITEILSLNCGNKISFNITSYLQTINVTTSHKIINQDVQNDTNFQYVQNSPNSSNDFILVSQQTKNTIILPEAKINDIIIGITNHTDDYYNYCLTSLSEKLIIIKQNIIIQLKLYYQFTKQQNQIQECPV